MSYRCEQHGAKTTDWCEECNKPLACDCSELETAKISDIAFGDRWTTDILITFCPCCGGNREASL